MFSSFEMIAVVGPTSSGKSELAVRLARQFQGEIVSADSRQVYHGLDLGTGKVPGRWKNGQYLYKGVPHYLIDVASPKRQFSAARCQKLAKKCIADIVKRGKLPIICGGTAQWVDAIVFGQEFPNVPPNARLRRELGKKTAAQLFAQLKKLDPERAAMIDPKNPRRLVRALEIILATGRPVSKLKQKTQYRTLWLGLKLPPEELNKKIDRRLQSRIKQGLFAEVKSLHRQGLAWKRLENFDLEYKYGALYLQGQLNQQEAVEQLARAIKQYAKRQLTWWKRNKEINWL